MPSFLVEAYVAAPDEARLAAVSRQALAVEAGNSIRYLGSLVLPEDEICFHIFEAPSVVALVQASQRCGLEYDRVVETIWIAGTLRSRGVEPV